MIEVNTDSALSFTCEHCDQQFSEFTVRISTLLYGAAFLVGHKACYVGITCPACIKTLLMVPDNLNALLYNIDEFPFPNGSYKTHHLKYNSSVLYKPDLIPELKEIFNGFFNVMNVAAPDFVELAVAHYHDAKNSEKTLLCTYAPGLGDLPYGPFTSVWWFQEKDLEKYLQIENEKGIRAFPRYVYKNEIYEKINNFSWKYHMGEKFSADAWVSAGEPIDGEIDSLDGETNPLSQLRFSVEDLDKHTKMFGADRESMKRFYIDMGLKPDLVEKIIENRELSHSDMDYLNQFIDEDELSTPSHDTDIEPIIITPRDREHSFQAESEFLEILFADPSPFIPSAIGDRIQDPFKELWKTINPFEGKTAPTDITKFEFDASGNDDQLAGMIADIKAQREKPATWNFLKENLDQFIKGLIYQFQKADFSYGYVWELKKYYIKKLHAAIQEEIREEARYAIFLEGNLWTFIFNGRKIRGLKGIGFRHIRELVMRPGQYCHAKDLIPDESVNNAGEKNNDSLHSEYETNHNRRPEAEACQNDLPIVKRFSAQYLADAPTLKEINEKMKELDEEIAKATRNGDFQVENELFKEKMSLMAYIKQNFDSKGNPRTFASEDKKYKDAIGNSIKRAIASLKKKDIEAGVHFEKAISGPSSSKPGYFPEEYYDWHIG